jgi:hypothetical protein
MIAPPSELARSSAGTFVTEARGFSPGAYVVPALVADVLSGRSWVVIGRKGSGKTALAEYVASLTTAADGKAGLCVLPMRSILEQPEVRARFATLHDDSDEVRAASRQYWALLLALALLIHLRSIDAADPAVKRAWRDLLVAGLLPGQLGSRFSNTLRRLWRRGFAVWLFSLQPETRSGFEELARIPAAALWDDLLAACERLESRRVIIVLDALDQLVGRASAGRKAPISPLFVGLLKALHDLRSGVSRASSTGPVRVSCLALLRTDLYLEAAVLIEERTHLEALLAPVDLQWTSAELRRMCGTELAKRCPAPTPPAASLGAPARLIAERPLPLGWETEHECLDDVLVELSAADGHSSPRDALDLAAELSRMQGVAVRCEAGGPVAHAPTRVIGAAIDLVAHRRREDTLRPLAPEVDAVLRRLRGRSRRLSAGVLDDACAAATVTRERAGGLMAALGVSTEVADEISVSPLHARPYGMFAARAATRVVDETAGGQQPRILRQAETKAAGYLAELAAAVSNGRRVSLGAALRAWLGEHPDNGLFIVLGDYGTGKSTFANALFLSRHLDHRTFGSSAPPVLLLDLGAVGEAANADAGIAAEAQKHGLRCSGLDDLLSYARATRALVILDAFDQMSPRPSEDDLLANAAFVRRIAEAAPSVLLSRTHLFTGRTEIRSFAATASPATSRSLGSTLPGLLLTMPDNVVVLQPLSDNEVSAVVAHVEESGTGLLSWIINTYDLAGLARTPLFLDMMIQTARQQDEATRVPARHSDLYQSFTRSWMSRQRSNWPRGLEAENVEEALATVAFELYRSDRGSLAIGELVRELPPMPGLDEETIWRALHGSTFLVLDRDDDRLRFSHDSFREYFAARAVFGSLVRGELATPGAGQYSQDYLTPQVDEFLLGLMEAAGEMARLTTALARHETVVVRMHAATSIGRWWDERAIDLLLSAFEGERDIGVAGRLAEALFARGREEALWNFLRELGRYGASSEDSGRPIGHRLLYDIDDEWQGTVPADIGRRLAASIEAGNARIRKYAVYMAGRLRCRNCAEAVARLAGGKEATRLTLYVAASLGRMGGPAARAALVAWSASDDLPEVLARRVAASLARLEAHASRTEA